METTEKGMKIVVTRAPRIRKANYADLPAESYYMRQLATFGPDRVFRYELGMKDVPSRRVDIQFVLPYDVGLGHASTGNAVVPFDSFDHMCQWVSNGRKLEDLGGDGYNEWVNVQNLAHGEYATIASCKHAFIENVGDLIHRVHGGFVHGLELYAAPSTYDVMVWPLGLGDTITITCKGQ